MLLRALYEAANIMLCRARRPFALPVWGKKIAEAKGAKRDVGNLPFSHVWEGYFSGRV